MKKTMAASFLAVFCSVILSVSMATAKSSCASHGYKSCADVCADMVPIFDSLGYDLTMGECVSANESGNPAMAICRNLQVADPFTFEDLFGNFGQCLKEVNQSIPKK